MTDLHTGFLLDIIENPADDTPRLVYADWLEDHGEPERAEFIRLQVELAHLEEALASDLSRTATSILERRDELKQRKRELLATMGDYPLNPAPRPRYDASVT